jgi:hypothetical protein
MHSKQASNQSDTEFRSTAVGRNQTSVTKRTCQVRWTEVATPNVRSLAFAIKQAGFSTRRSRKARRRGRGEEEFWRFAQSLIEHCAKRHTVLLGGLCASLPASLR